MIRLCACLLVAAAIWLAPPAAAAANVDAFNADLTAAGIPAYAFTTLEMWAQSACRLVPKSGAYDAQVIAALPNDVRGNDIDLTPAQAAAMWTSAKTNIC